jgi:hypothetical protein
MAELEELPRDSGGQRTSKSMPASLAAAVARAEHCPKLTRMRTEMKIVDADSYVSATAPAACQVDAGKERSALLKEEERKKARAAP